MEDKSNYPYEDLRIAIVAKAVSDYRVALASDNERYIKPLEKFFLSSWGQFLSGDNGEYIIDRCRAEVKPKRRTPKRTVKITPIEKET